MKKILIVDDATFMQKVTSSMLKEKYETVCAGSAEEALEIYEREKPDMILTDLYMTGMTGMEMQRLLQEKYQEHIPIMFMTSDKREENETRSLADGAMDYIHKPFTKEVLLRRVDNIMRNVEQIARLRIVAETDPMTGLLNKTHAQKVMADLCRRASGTLMMVDLDSFKLVNDIYGHGMGDKILIRFADILRSVIRSTDMAGRMGGDEFMIFCQDVKQEEVIAEKAKTINDTIYASAKEFMGEDMNIPLGASVGAVIVPEEGTEFPLLYQKADQALYRVKQNGKHGYAVYHSDDSREEVSGEGNVGAAGTLDKVQMILAERNRQRGAYELGFSAFQTVYRFLIRAMENYHRPVELVLYTLQSASGGRVPEETLERFGQVLAASLRRSDVLCRNGKNQFMIMLTEVEDTGAEFALARITKNWKAEYTNDDLEITCEAELLKA